MQRLLVLAAILMAGVSAKAETFVCSFTEPFYTLTYDTSTQILQIKDDAEGTIKYEKDISFTVLDAGKFELRRPMGSTLVTLTLNFQGSDGMSNQVFPYEATTVAIGGANNGIGGCTSSALPATEGEN